MSALACRHCGSLLLHEILDLGNQPPSNSYLTENQLYLPEITYPLKLYICTNCWLVQLPAHAPAEKLFTKDYAYFSSTSSTWLAHAKSYVSNVVKHLHLNKQSNVVELASNDGYLLQYVSEQGIPCLGIEPTHSTAEASRRIGIPTVEKFFSSELAETLDKADLVIANNVLAHVPDINDFMLGISILMKKTGSASIEFPNLLNLLKGLQFDTIYHEHYSYLSLHSVKQICESVGLEVYDVEKLNTHGGSLRVWLSHVGTQGISKNVSIVLNEELDNGLPSIHAYEDLQINADRLKNHLLQMLLSYNDSGSLIIGYGAAAKGNTLLNFAGIRPDLLRAVVDKAKAKQCLYLPGSHIPIINPTELDQLKPDALLLLPWNLLTEIQFEYPSYKLITAIPTLTTHPVFKQV